jgi:hypothetical protein
MGLFFLKTTGMGAGAPGDVICVNETLCVKEDEYHLLSSCSMDSDFYWAWLTIFHSLQRLLLGFQAVEEERQLNSSNVFHSRYTFI